jgi:multicomponent Na+:H+ antiporter subunit D
MIYGLTGSLQIKGMYLLLSNVPEAKVFIAVLLMIVGLSVELKLMPVGSWAKGIYGNSNELTGAIFASVLAPTFALVFGRLLQEVIVLNDATGYLLMTIALATLVLAELAAYKQVALRKTLAFSSIAQSGLIVILFMFNLVYPAILLIINQTLSKAILFWIAGKLNTAYGSDDGQALKGVFYHHKVLGVLFSIAGLSMMGMPLFFGFIAKINMVIGSFTIGWIGFPIIILAIAIVEVAYLMRWLLLLWSPANEGQLAVKSTFIEKEKMFDLSETVAIVLVATTLFVIGLSPVIVNDLVKDAAVSASSSQDLYLVEGGTK